MTTYRLDEHDKPVVVDDYEDFAVWYCTNKSALILERTDIYDRRGRFVTTIITRFRSQVDGVPETGTPLVWVTETLEGDFLGASPTRESALAFHDRQVRVLTDYYNK